MLMLIFYGVLCFWCVANGVRAPVYADVDLGKGIGDELAGFRESIASMKSDIESLKYRKKKVSMVACMKGPFAARGAGSVIQILDIKTIYGITPSSQYRNGIFTCKDRGLYMVFATVTSAIHTSFKLMRNKTSVSRGYIGGYSGHWSSGSSIAFVQLDEKDQISIQADKQMTIGDRSCFGVIKID
ncbi:uncharacterized protein LOC134701480 [Mytilus trossulus]|uniref:uncharacterized protein LOC134701480 n=1 Tax=Mytilus trossulus TaxID=6551 RepID=UPI00300441D7